MNESFMIHLTLWWMVVVFIDPDFIAFYRGFIVILTSVSGFNGFAESQRQCLSKR